ncbi:MAG: TA system VapC family ribonuclease toxin [Thermoanaerobaculia bacterium]
MRALLDVNVLLALLDADHIDHLTARSWLEHAIEDGWASCAITQNGFLRVITQPRYPSPVSAAEAMARLTQATRTEYHEYLPCNISILDSGIHPDRVHGSRQVTDVYLLALAIAHGCCFVTFDRSIPLSAVNRAVPEHLVTL